MVPVVEARLLVATAAWGESPASINAGREIKPPPPPMESISPARKVRGQIIKKEIGFMSFSFGKYIKNRKKKPVTTQPVCESCRRESDLIPPRKAYKIKEECTLSTMCLQLLKPREWELSQV